MTPVSSLDHFLDPTTGFLTPQIAQRIVDWRPDATMCERVQELGRKANEGTLSEAEQIEYEQYVNDGDVIALIQLRARKILGQLPSR